MIANYARVIFSLLLIGAFIMPGAVAGMSAEDEVPPDSATYVVEIPLTGNIEATEPQAPPPVEVSANVGSNKAVYVDEQNPTTNMNSGGQKTFLRVGIGPEFGGELWTLLSFSPIEEAQGGPIPDDAEITRAKIKIYKESGTSGTVNIHSIGEDFNENTVTWNTKPSTSGAVQSSGSVPSANGWCYLDAPVSTIENAMQFNRPARLALRPTWTTIDKSVAFYSNEHPSLSPVLVIYYEGSAPPGATPAPEPTPPAPSSSDTTPCTLTYTVNPPNPSPGQQVTITAQATDDQAMYYLTIVRGSEELAWSDTTTGQRTLEVSYTETAQLPSMSYQLFADDAGPAPPVSRMVTVPVTGSGTAPTVTITAEWVDVEEVIPDRYRLIKNDGQRVRITAEASDPDGIRNLHIFVNSTEYPFTYTGQTSVRETVEWVNNQPSQTRFSYRAYAQDREAQTTSADGASYDIAQPQDIRIIWSEASKDINFGLKHIPYHLPWERMCQIFGAGECWYDEGWGWRDSSADRYYEDYIRSAGWGGQCFGFATMTAELYHGRIAASELDEVTGGAWELDYSRDTFPGSGSTGAWIQARQAGQAGEEVAIPRYNRGNMGGSQTLSWVENDLADDDPGVLCIRELDEGHAVTPWMVRYMADGTQRIYVYDSNKVTGIHNANADINNFENYPYMVIDGSAWSYQWDATTVWDDEICYFTYEEACGDMGEVVTDPPIATEPGYSYRTPYLTDHDIPNSTDWYIAWVTPGADAYAEDEEGNVTGIYKGQLRQEIPGSMALVPFTGGLFTDQEMYIFPKGKKLSIHAEGTDDTEYNLNIRGESTLYSITNKKTRKGVDDMFGFEPWGGSLGYRLRVQPGVADDDFTIMIAASFAGLVAALDEESIDREYTMDGIEATEESDFSVFAEEGGDSFVVECYGDDIQFDAVTRSTESADVLDPDIDHGYIPSSVEEDITVERGRAAEITPETWASDEEHAELHTLKSRATGDGGGGFPLIPVVIGAVVVVAGAIIGILFGKGILGKKAK
ncbi:MAG: DNRLRE domain-containing protein [Dehalococcoidia bacterium]